ncbi:MAG: hypothetical protein RJA24_1709 [Pseudomonadota bacterium]|jgi:hypothetical protein
MHTDSLTKSCLTEYAMHRTIIAQLAATITHDLGNIRTLMQAGIAVAGTAVPALLPDGVGRLAVLSELIAAFDRGVILGDEATALEVAVNDATTLIRGAYDLDLQVDDAEHNGALRCSVSKDGLTAAIYAALDAAARAASARHPIRLYWFKDGRFAGVRIEVPALMSASSFNPALRPARHGHLGLDQALALTHKVGGYGWYCSTESLSQIELRWRLAPISPDRPNGPVIWLENADANVLAIIPSAAAWSRGSGYRRLLDGTAGLPRAVVGRVSAAWNHQPLLDTLRWLQACGTTLLPLVFDTDAAAFIAEEFGADCPIIRWPQDMGHLSQWAQQ